MDNIIEKLQGMSNERRNYLISSLIQHLSYADQYQRLRSLFDNDSWLHIRYEHSGYTYDSYLDDLSLTWESHVLNVLDPSEELLVDNLHFALITSSINTIKSNHSPQLIIQALQQKLSSWTPARALAFDSGQHEDRIDLYIYLFEACELTSQQERIALERVIKFFQERIALQKTVMFGSVKQYIQHGAKLFHNLPSYMKTEYITLMLASYEQISDRGIDLLSAIAQERITSKEHQKLIASLIIERINNAELDLQQIFNAVLALVKQMPISRMKEMVSWVYPLKQLKLQFYPLINKLLTDVTQR